MSNELSYKHVQHVPGLLLLVLAVLALPAMLKLVAPAVSAMGGGPSTAGLVAGTAAVATDPMGIEQNDVFITLKPRKDWTTASTQAPSCPMPRVG